MLKIGLTGNIASGKSTVEDFIKSSGFQVFDTDKIAHSILEKSEEVKTEFKNYDILSEQKIDRKKLAKIVFSNKELMQKLEKIIHPKVRAEIISIFKRFQTEKAIFITVPQLFEAGFEDLFDKIILVTAPRELRLKRLMKRNNLTKQEAELRLKAQIDEEIKIPKSDFIIENNSNQENLSTQIKEILSQIK